LKEEKIRGRINRGKQAGGSREGKKNPHILVGNEADIPVRWRAVQKPGSPNVSPFLILSAIQIIS
jgi:hypothetical protein